MKHRGKHNSRILTLLALLAVLVFPAAVRVSGQNVQQPATAPETQPNADPIRQLNLSPEQREQIRSIRENNRTERLAIKSHLDNANRALEEVLNAETPDESLVEQRLRDVAAAQASVMRMRILTEIRIRRVLTQEQRTLLRSLQQQAQQERRERQLDNAEQRKERREERSRGLNQRNGLRPVLPRRRP
ncbi:MAG TPA: periplasmic heavy metal sensor [Pyrinomonadaceae bacterium]|jgi:Spy/CpxP family protein refolding chaperone|nr:periplasmic heavy metal sensor [Pyrinomonadaceae bacterium]